MGGEGGNDGLLGFLGVVVYLSRPEGLLGDLGGERVWKKYGVVAIKLVLIWGRCKVL